MESKSRPSPAELCLCTSAVAGLLACRRSYANVGAAEAMMINRASATKKNPLEHKQQICSYSRTSPAWPNAGVASRASQPVTLCLRNGGLRLG